MYLGIEIGGTKLQAGLGDGRGVLTDSERVTAQATSGAAAIRDQIEQIALRLLKRNGASPGDLDGIGIGFGGPVDTTGGRVAKSHQVDGWDAFPLADWCTERLGQPCVLHNDADTAGLAEAVLGAGVGYSPVFYMTVGSGIGGGLIIDQTIYRGAGAGASEVGHLEVPARMQNGDYASETLESHCSGWGIAERMRQRATEVLARGDAESADATALVELTKDGIAGITPITIAKAAQSGNQLAQIHLRETCDSLAWAINQVIRLLCPKRIVIGGGVSELGEDLLFAPLRAAVERHMFPPFQGQCEIVPASLGEAVVVHGALLLAAQNSKSL
jgi:glucokinase